MSSEIPSQSPHMHRVVVTGIGLITPLGNTTESTWQRLLAGESAGELLQFPDLPQMAGLDWAGCPVAWNELPDDYQAEQRLNRLALLTARAAIADAGGWSELTADRKGCVFGTSKVDQAALQAPDVTAWQLFPSHPAACIAREFDCRAAALCPVAACATGVVSMLRGSELIREGLADCVLAGGVDVSLQPTLLASYRRLGVLARPNGFPQRACRPFDRDREGFLVGEGAACLVLEERDRARARGAGIYAEVLSGVVAGDPAGLTLVDASGAPLARVIRRVLKQAGCRPAEIEAVALHGTATRLNDVAEARALQEVFGDRVGELPVWSTKGATGHLMGAAGAVETALSVLALQRGILLPTANFATPDPECPLRLSQQPERRSLRTLLKTSLGFGGHVAALLLQAASS
jgi:3-oxoacyl-[acyl-carrier-protein] synthase II